MPSLKDFGMGKQPFSKGFYHWAMSRLVDKGIVGMDGFKYCWPEVAKRNWEVCHQWSLGATNDDSTSRNGEKETKAIPASG